MNISKIFSSFINYFKKIFKYIYPKGTTIYVNYPRKEFNEGNFESLFSYIKRELIKQITS